MPKIIFSIGHNSNDPGAVANGTTEHEEVKKIVNKAVLELQKAGLDVLTIPTDLTLAQKIEWANNNSTGDDFLLAVHLNSVTDASATGTETWFYSGADDSEKFAKVIQKELVSVLKLKDRSVHGDQTSHHGQLGIIRDTHAKTWLVELGFLSNSSDLSVVRDKGIEAVYKASLKFFSNENPFLKSEDNLMFKDVPLDHWAFNLITEAKKKGIIKGYPDGNFKPDGPVSRAEVLQILKNLNLF